jgi:hypothetical protein
MGLTLQYLFFMKALPLGWVKRVSFQYPTFFFQFPLKVGFMFKAQGFRVLRVYFSKYLVPCLHFITVETKVVMVSKVTNARHKMIPTIGVNASGLCQKLQHNFQP